MKRQRVASKTAGIFLSSARTVLKSSTKANHSKPAIPSCMSYKDLIKVVGVDPETSPTSWRKAIDHSAETVVFFQVDLRGTIPRMYKSVRICREEGTVENKELRLVPSVYVGDTLLSSTYVKTIIGRGFLSDEDDLMKLLEHAGILQEYDETAVEQEQDVELGDNADEEAVENDPPSPEPEPRRAKRTRKSLEPEEVAETRQQVIKRRKPTTAASRDSTESLRRVTGGRQPIDLSAMLLSEENDQSSSRVADREQDADDLDQDDISSLPAGNDDANDDLPLGYSLAAPSSHYLIETKEASDPAADAETDVGQDFSNQADHATKFPYEIRGNPKKKMELAPNLPGNPIWIEKVIHERLINLAPTMHPKKWMKAVMGFLIKGTADYKGDGIRLLYERRAAFLRDQLRDTGEQKKPPGIKAVLGDEFVLAVETYFEAHHPMGKQSASERGLVTSALNAWKDYHLKQYATRTNLPFP